MKPPSPTRGTPGHKFVDGFEDRVVCVDFVRAPRNVGGDIHVRGDFEPLQFDAAGADVERECGWKCGGRIGVALLPKDAHASVILRQPGKPFVDAFLAAEREERGVVVADLESAHETERAGFAPGI